MSAERVRNPKRLKSKTSKRLCTTLWKLSNAVIKKLQVQRRTKNVKFR
jgi:hypothetical protein